MIVYLATGGIKSVTPVDGAVDCVLRSRYEQRFDPRVSYTYCLPVHKDVQA